MRMVWILPSSSSTLKTNVPSPLIAKPPTIPPTVALDRLGRKRSKCARLFDMQREAWLSMPMRKESVSNRQCFAPRVWVVEERSAWKWMGMCLRGLPVVGLFVGLSAPCKKRGHQLVGSLATPVVSGPIVECRSLNLGGGWRQRCLDGPRK